METTMIIAVIALGLAIMALGLVLYLYNKLDNIRLRYDKENNAWVLSGNLVIEGFSAVLGRHFADEYGKTNYVVMNEKK